MLTAERSEYRTINFEETELCLGLPGKNHDAGGDLPAKKRGFSETDADAVTGVDLKLNLSTAATATSAKESKVDAAVDQKVKAADLAKPPAKAQVVGWPPVRSSRKNMVSLQKNSSEEATDEKATVTANTTATTNTTATATATANGSGAFVKVSMDGAPYLRKVDLKLYKCYQQLSDALAKMFSSFTIGNCGSQGMKDLMKESKLIDLLNGTDYVATYEDKEGDWMLVGDVPWEMFVNSCKRLRIMKGSEAIGLAPRAVEKCKSRI